ncbi:MAG TPA: uracil phosphoribosyltransferase [Firmicutes bacterium]|nr:uracil phosphoribosyltransferase [Bacillota bacterium]
MTREWKQVHLLDHPLIQHKLSYIRDENTGVKEFRELVEELAMLMAYDATRDLPLEEVIVKTPISEAVSHVISGKKLGVIAILRAGLGMVPGVLRLIPAAKVGHIGLYRDPDTLKPVQYYCKLPADSAERDLIVVDPMLATGGSVALALDLIKQKSPRSIKVMCLIAAPEGLDVVVSKHPDVEIYCAAIDEKLNSHGYIVPGLGDAGDRLYGTK